MRVAVFGANGQLGCDLVKVLKERNHFPLEISHREFDITWDKSLPFQVDSIINTVAYHDLIRCETYPVIAYNVNALGARNLARICKEKSCSLVHISTDYVYGDETMFTTESQPPKPLNIYGNTKLSGEYFVRANVDAHWIVRTASLYGENPCRGKGGMNFVDKMLRLAKEGKEIFVKDVGSTSPTYTYDLAGQIVRLIENPPEPGVYHAAGEGCPTWYAFAKSIFETFGVEANLKPVRHFEVEIPRRPYFSGLVNSKLMRLPIYSMRPWRESLKSYAAAQSARQNEVLKNS